METNTLFHPLQMEQGIASGDIQKLNDAGYHTVESIAHATVRKLSEVKGISENKVRSGGGERSEPLGRHYCSSDGNISYVRHINDMYLSTRRLEAIIKRQ